MGGVPFVRRVSDIIQGLGVIAIIGLATTVIGLRETVSNGQLTDKYIVERIEGLTTTQERILSNLETIHNSHCSASRCMAIEANLDRLDNKIAAVGLQGQTLAEKLAITIEKRVALSAELMRLRDRLDNVAAQKTGSLIGQTPVEISR